MARSLAYLASIIGHPLLVLSYVLLILLALNPYLFGLHTLSDPRAVMMLFSVFSTTVLIPGVGIALLKPLGLVKSLEMEDKQERIGPYIITGIFYLWLFKNLLSLGQSPTIFTGFVLGATIGLFVAFMINIFLKISVHGVGMGGFIAMLILLLVNSQAEGIHVPFAGGYLWVSLLLLTAIGVLIAGCVGVARLFLGAHTPIELYLGYAVGFGATLLGYSILV